MYYLKPCSTFLYNHNVIEQYHKMGYLKKIDCEEKGKKKN